MNEMVVKAIQDKLCLKINYDGGSRIIEPHCHGLTTKGNLGLRAFQTSGHSNSGESLGWKMFDLAKATSIEIVSQTFSTPRDGYKKGDRGMKEIFSEL